MALNKVEFRELIQEENGGKFEFRYIGIPKSDDIDTNKVQELITRFMHQITYHGNMLENVQFLRTILKDYNEKLLVVNYQDAKTNELVKFDNSHIFLFEKTEKDNDSEYAESFVVKYTPGNNINFMFTDYKHNKIDYNIPNLSDRVRYVLTEIAALNNAKPIVLGYDSKILIEVYKSFFNEYPDVSDKNIEVKMQTMLSILSTFGMYLGGEHYGYILSDERKVPLSMNLVNRIYQIFPLGQITKLDNSIVPDDAKKKISVVGDEIRNAIGSENKDDSLIIIAKILHDIKHNLVSKYSKDEIESSMKLTKKINNKISNQ